MMLNVGDKLTAQWTEELIDYVTEGITYEVSRVSTFGFYIINDRGEECFPISSQFKREGATK